MIHMSRLFMASVEESALQDRPAAHLEHANTAVPVSTYAYFSA